MEIFCADSGREHVGPGRSMVTVSDYGDIFDGQIPLEGLKIIRQPLSWSIQRDHAVFNPTVDRDPLVDFGGSEGVLPGYSVEDSALFRDILTRWQAPHARAYWTSLRECAERFIPREFTYSDLLTHSSPECAHYSLLPAYLNTLGAMLVALNQVFQGLSEFLHEDSSMVFTVDVNYAMLRALCWSPSAPALLLTIPLLQESVSNGIKHILG